MTIRIRMHTLFTLALALAPAMLIAPSAAAAGNPSLCVAVAGTVIESDDDDLLRATRQWGEDADIADHGVPFR